MFTNTVVGIPGHTHSDSIYPELFYTDQIEYARRNPHQLIRNHYAWAKYKYFFGKGYVQVLAGHTANKLQEYEEKVTIPAIDLNLNTTNLTIRYLARFKKDMSLIIGGQGLIQFNYNDPVAEEFLIPDGSTRDLGVFALFTAKIKDLQVLGGIRFDNRYIGTVQTGGFEETFSNQFQGINYALGLKYQKKSQTLRLNLSTGFRAPHVSELLSDGVHHGTTRYVKGNSNLLAEQATQLDVSYEFRGEHLAFIVNPYYNVMNGFINLVGSNNFIDGYREFNYVKLDNVNLYGGDLGVHYHPHRLHWLHFENSWSYVIAEEADGTPIFGIPQAKVNSILRFDFESNKTFRLNQISLQHIYYFDQNQVAADEISTEGYHLINLGGSMILERSKGQFEFLFGVKNLLDTDYINHLSFLKTIGVPGPGINGYIGLKFKLNQSNKS